MSNKIFMARDDFTHCTPSSYGVNRVKAFLNLNQYELIETISDADYVIVNTCWALQEVEDAICNYIESLADEIRAKNIKLIIYGCLVNIASERMKSYDFVYKLVGTKQFTDMDNIFDHSISISTINSIDINHFETLYAAKAFDIHKTKKYYVEIARWCIHNCSYCAIKKSIWYVTSHPKNIILEEVKEAVWKWYNEIVLVSDDVWSYGYDSKEKFSDLFNAICEISDNFLIDINYVEPSEMIKCFDDIKHNFYRVSQITCPIQSTSNRILTLMKRKYTQEEIVILLKNMRQYWRKELRILNHIIYAYPTETDEEFQGNLKFVKNFDQSIFMIYSYRSHTKKYSQEDILSKETILKRYSILKKLNHLNNSIFDIWKA